MLLLLLMLATYSKVVVCQNLKNLDGQKENREKIRQYLFANFVKKPSKDAAFFGRGKTLVSTNAKDIVLSNVKIMRSLRADLFTILAIVISRAQMAVRKNLLQSIAKSWKRFSVARFICMKLFITKTAIDKTIVLKIWNSGILAIQKVKESKIKFPSLSLSFKNMAISSIKFKPLDFFRCRLVPYTPLFAPTV